MTKTYVTDVKRWITKNELVNKIKDKKVEARMLQRLLFIKYLYEGDSVPEAAEKVGVTLPTAYEWRKQWNHDGYEGLILNFAGRAPIKLSRREKQELKEVLEQRDDWSTQEVRRLIMDSFDIDYTLRHVSRLLKSMGMKQRKSFQHDYRRSTDAEEQLKNK